MKTINTRKVAMVLGGILSATLFVGCFGGGGGYPGYGYSSSPYGGGYGGGYSSNYNSYGSSYPYSGYSTGYSYPRTYGNSYNNSYNAGYHNGARVAENREQHHDRDANEHFAVTRDSGNAHVEARHSTARESAHENYSRRDSGSSEHTDKN